MFTLPWASLWWEMVTLAFLWCDPNYIHFLEQLIDSWPAYPFFCDASSSWLVNEIRHSFSSIFTVFHLLKSTVHFMDMKGVGFHITLRNYQFMHTGCNLLEAHIYRWKGCVRGGWSHEQDWFMKLLLQFLIREIFNLCQGKVRESQNFEIVAIMAWLFVPWTLSRGYKRCRFT